MGWTTPSYSTADSSDVLMTRTGGDLQVELLVEIEYPNKDPGGKPLFATFILPLAE